MLKRTKRVASLTVIAVLLFALVGCGSKTEPTTNPGGSSAAKLEKTELKVGVSVPSVAFLPLYLAIQEKTFEAEGLNVTLVSFQNGTDNTKAAMSGSIDIVAGAFPESVLTPTASGGDIKMFYPLCNYPSYKWYAKKDIKTVQDAKGKKFSVSKIGGQSDIMTRWVVKKAGLDPEKDIKAVQGGAPMARLAALQSGAVDVAVLSDPGTFVAEREGYTMLLSLKQYVSEYPNETFNATSKFLKENPESLKAFIRAYNKAVQIMNKDEAKSMTAIEKFVKVTGQDAKDAFDNYKPYFPDYGMIPQEGIDMLQEISLQDGTIKEKYPNDKLIDSTYINLFKKK